MEQALAVALAHHQAGRLQEAEQVCRRIVEAAPNHARAWHLLGVLAQQQGRFELAREHVERAVRLDAGQADFHYTLGQVCRRLGRSAEAIASYRRALDLRPQFAEAHNNLGILWKERGNLDEAVACYRRALRANPELAEAHNNLGNARQQQGNLDEAIACFRRALRSRPDYANAYSNLGNAWRERGNLGEALASYQRAIQLRPDCAEFHNNLGTVWNSLGKITEAAACYRRALELRPDCPEAHHSLGMVLRDQGRPEEAIACYQRALQQKPDYIEAYNDLLCAFQYRPGVTLAELKTAHAEFERRHAAPLRAAWRAHENLPAVDRPLRLGFVSPDFRRHPVSYFLIRVLENLDRSRCDVVCYSDRIAPDEMTARCEAAATLWRSACGLSGERLAEQIRADRIDILFDLAGHTGNNRMLVFARKPAPIQITWIGYVGTTGLAAMDYILADPYQIPSEAEPQYHERVLRMRHGYVCFDPPAAAPDVGPLPALAAGHVTFGSFNNPAKISPPVVACWSEILRRTPQARLILKYRGLNDPAVASHFQGLFAKEGVAAGRVELQGWSPYLELLGHYNQVDLALDTFPYSGGLTTCEALWMGVPVVTCPGETFASRHSLSHLSNVGLTDTIASNFDQYVDMAVALARDLPRLATMRAGLRQQVAQSPLCDGRTFAEDMLDILRGAWREWVQSERHGSSRDAPH